MHHHGYLRGWRRVATAGATHQAIDHHHANARNVAQLHAFQEGAACGLLGTVHEHKVRSAAHLDQAAVELANAGCVAGGETKH